MGLIRNIKGDFRSEMVTDDEILQFLLEKLAEKYPKGEVEPIAPLVGKGMVFQVRTTPAVAGVYNAVSCAVQVWRKKDGTMQVQVNMVDADGLDTIQMVMSLFNMRKRSALVEEVAGWMTSFLEAKKNQSSVSTQSGDDTSAASGVPVKCVGCGADISVSDSVCPYCGADVAGNMPAAQAMPVPALAPVTHGPAKSKNTYLILGILLGSLGVHNFYAGYTGKGVLQLLITILTCGYGGFATWIWAIIEVCTVKQDAQGVPFA